MDFFATTINTVFTDEVMHFALRGQQKEASVRYPGFVKRRMKHGKKGPKPGTNCLYSCVHEAFTEYFYFKSMHTATHEDRMIVPDDNPLCWLSWDDGDHLAMHTDQLHPLQ